MGEPRRRSVTRRVLLLLSLGVVAWAAIVVPMPFEEVQPGRTLPLEERIDLSAAEEPVNGDLLMLTVVTTVPNALELVWIAVHPDRDAVPAQASPAAGIDQEAYRELQAAVHESSFLTAVALAAQQAGLDVGLVTRAVVGAVATGGPSDGALAQGDDILAIDGTTVSSGAELIDVLGEIDAPRRVIVRVLRDGEQRDVAIDLAVLEATGRPGLGILVETVAVAPDLPFDATLDRGGVGGPSAGLMMAITATDLLLPEDLTAGRTIAGTGTIDGEGRVGEVSGLVQKARLVAATGADLLLVPASQLDEAAPAVDAGITVVGVETLDDALAVLRDR